MKAKHDSLLIKTLQSTRDSIAYIAVLAYGIIGSIFCCKKRHYAILHNPCIAEMLFYSYHDHKVWRFFLSNEYHQSPFAVKLVIYAWLYILDIIVRWLKRLDIRKSIIFHWCVYEMNAECRMNKWTTRRNELNQWTDENKVWCLYMDGIKRTWHRASA